MWKNSNKSDEILLRRSSSHLDYLFKRRSFKFKRTSLQEPILSNNKYFEPTRRKSKKFNSFRAFSRAFLNNNSFKR